MNRTVRAMDWQSALCLDAEEVGPDDWRWTGSKYGGLLRGNRQHLISALAREIVIRRGQHEEIINGVSALHSDAMPHVMLDELGNTWIEGQYMAPDRYLPLLIPENHE